MSVGFPAIDSYRNTIPTRTLDPTTTSGFTEDANVTHAYYTQLSDGWVMQSGRTTTASLDRDGRLGTVSYRFQMQFEGWAAGPQNIWVTAHEFGSLVILDFAGSTVGTNMSAASIDSGDLPVSLRPAFVKHSTLSITNNAANTIGTVTIMNGNVTIYAGGINTIFTNGAAGGFYPFTVMYDRRT